MGNAPIFVSMKGAEQLKRLSKDLKAAPKELKRELRKEIRQAGKPVVADVRRAALGVDVKSSRGGTADPDNSTGLRAAVARATGLSITASGIRIRVSAKRLARTHDPRLAKYLDASLGRYKRWRHPVFRKTVWTEQAGEPFFFVTIRKHTRDFRKACFDAMESTAKRITK